MPEANEILEDVYPDYPLSFALTGLGVAIVLAIEQITLAVGAKTREGHQHNNHHDHSHGHEHGHVKSKSYGQPLVRSSSNTDCPTSHCGTSVMIQCAGLSVTRLLRTPPSLSDALAIVTLPSACCSWMASV